MTQISCHKPVLLEEVLESLKVTTSGIYLDCTFGGGGHTRAILEANNDNVVISIDRNKEVLPIAESFSEEFGERFRFINMPFSKIGSLSKFGPFNGILADLGLSSDQLSADSGFSFNDKTLDMRMDQSGEEKTAKDLINSISENELRSIFKRGGATKAIGVVTKNIIKQRPYESAKELANAVLEVYPKKLIKPGRHPATVFFQAIRIEVNDELNEIREFLKSSLSLLADKGLVSVISFHSLEDKLIAKQFRKWATGDTLPALHPQSALKGQSILGRLTTKKAITPRELEISENPRSRSAMLRVFEKGFIN